MTKRNDSTDEMKEAEIILELLRPSHKNIAEPIKPTVRALHHPPSRREASALLDLLGFFAAGADMRRVAELNDQVADFIEVIALVEAQVLTPVRPHPWPLDGEAVQRRFDQAHVVAVGTVDCEAEGHAAPFTQEAAFYAAFGSVGGIGSRFFPRRAEPWSWLRPLTASAIEFL